jgi:hypothetical protein
MKGFGKLVIVYCYQGVNLTSFVLIFMDLLWTVGIGTTENRLIWGVSCHDIQYKITQCSDETYTASYINQTTEHIMYLELE